MSAKVRSGGESAVAIAPPATETVAKGGGQAEVEWAKCECCGLTEECTPAYIARVRDRFHGRWICGLCGEAVKDEILRSAGAGGRLISTEEALDRHMAFSKSFRLAGPPASTAAAEHLIAAMKQLLRRSLASPPRAMRSTPTSPHGGRGGEGGGGDRGRRPAFARSGSCFPSLAGQREL